MLYIWRNFHFLIFLYIFCTCQVNAFSLSFPNTVREWAQNSLKMSFERCGPLIKIPNEIDHRLRTVVEGAIYGDHVKIGAPVRYLSETEIASLSKVPNLPGGVRRVLPFLQSVEDEIVGATMGLAEEEYGPIPKGDFSIIQQNISVVYRAFVVCLLLSDFGDADIENELLNKEAVLKAKQMFLDAPIDRSLVVSALKALGAAMNSYVPVAGGCAGFWTEAAAPSVYYRLSEGIRAALY